MLVVGAAITTAFGAGDTIAGIEAGFVGIVGFLVATGVAGIGVSFCVVLVWLQPVMRIAIVIEVMLIRENVCFIIFKFSGLKLKGGYNAKANIGGCDAWRVAPTICRACAIAFIVVRAAAKDDCA